VTSTIDPTRPRPPAGTSAPAGTRGRSATVLVGLLVVYLVLLAWAVLWKLETPWVGGAYRRVVKFVPFVSTARTGASTPVDVVTNVLLFVPFGVYLGLLAPRWSWRKVVGAAAGVSLVLEVAQYVLAVGSTDLTDVLVNSAGGAVGLGLLALARRRLGDRTGAVMARVCANGTVLALVAAGLVVASPVRYAPPGQHDRDVHVPLHDGDLGRPGPAP